MTNEVLNVTSMSESEEVALEWVLSHGLSPSQVERSDRFQSIDFVIEGVLGVEVKTDEYYHLSSSQIEAISELEEVMVVVVPETLDLEDVWVEDIITGVQMPERSELTGETVASDADKHLDNTVTMRASMASEDFNRFKAVKSRLQAETNDEAIMSLVQKYQESPSVQEAIEVLEEEGYEVTKQQAEEY